MKSKTEIDFINKMKTFTPDQIQARKESIQELTEGIRNAENYLNNGSLKNIPYKEYMEHKITLRHLKSLKKQEEKSLKLGFETLRRVHI